MKITRRRFMQSAAAACAASALPLGAVAFQDGIKVEGVTPETNTTCEMCSYRCPVRVHDLGSGKIFIEGNKNAGHQKTRICARGSSGYSLLNDPNRIVKPMKRKGERGAGEWEVISWEQAYTEIAEKMNALKSKHGAETIAFSAKSGSLYSQFKHFAQSFGSPNIFSHSSMCPGGRYVTADIMLGGDMVWDLKNTKYLIVFGHNLYEGVEVGDTYKTAAMQNGGGKIVSFDPRLSVVSSKADEYFFIKPGTDIVVALAMCNELIKNDLYDKEFVVEYSIGFSEFARSIENITPEFAEMYSGVKAEVIRRITREFAAAAPAAVVSPGHRTTYSFEEFDTRRALFALNALVGNFERKGGLYSKRSPEAYNKLVGTKAAPELKKIKVEYPKPAARLDALDGERFKYSIKRGGIYQRIIETALSDKPYPVKGWVMSRTNPMQTLADYPKMVEAMKAMELIVSCDVYMTDSAAFADYFLPEATYLERYEQIENRSGQSPAYSLRQPAVKTIGDAKSSALIWYELGLKLGLEEFYPWGGSMEKYIEMQTADAPELLKELKEKGFVSYGTSFLLREPSMIAKAVEKYPTAAANLGEDGTFANHMKFKTKSGKIEFYSEEIEQLWPGYGVPRFRNIKIAGSDELLFIQAKAAVHTNAATAFVPSLSDLMPSNPVWINTETAKTHGIKNGDEIVLENATGSEKGVALVTDNIRPDTVFTYMSGFGVKNGYKQTAAAASGVMCSNLLPHAVNDVTGMAVHTSAVKIFRA